MIEFKEANNFLFKLQKNKNKIRVYLNENTVFIEIKDYKKNDYFVWKQTPKGRKKNLIFPSIYDEKYFCICLFETIFNLKNSNFSLMILKIPNKKRMEYNNKIENWYRLFIKSLKENFQQMYVRDLHRFSLFETETLFNLLEKNGFKETEYCFKKYLTEDLHIRADFLSGFGNLLSGIVMSYQNDDNEKFRGEKVITNFSLEAIEKEIISFLNEDYKCPRCGNYMIIRRNGKTRKLFWGCINYPDCNMTLPYKYRKIPNKASHKQNYTKYLVENG